MAEQALKVATETTAPISPVAASERIEVVDVLRGFALFGILLINMTAFKAPGGPPGIGIELGSVDRLVIQGLILFVESKFFTLFSFLFGLGFSIQLLRAQGRGLPFVPRFARRLLVLGLFGVAHIVLLWDGDILLLYALVGFLLLLFRNASLQTLQRWIAALLLIPLVLYSVGFGVLQVARGVPSSAAQIQGAEVEFLTLFAEERAETLAVLSDGSYGEALAKRVAGYSESFPLLVSRVPSVLAMFLLGLYVGKQGILQRVGDHLPLLRRVRFWGLSLGILVSLLVTVGTAVLPPISAIVVLFFNQALAGPLLSMGYAATLVLLAHQPRWQRAFRPLAATGRLALTNYLLQSLISTTLFNGYGFGLIGNVSAAWGVALAVGIYAAQVVFSLWWLRRFRFGPMEWLWRTLTYGQVQPLGVRTMDDRR